MNRVAHIGYVQNELELFERPGGKSFTRIFIKCRDNYGKWDKILYVAWGNKAVNLVNNDKVKISIGDMLGIEGTQKTKNIAGEDGKRKLFIYNRLDKITFLGRSENSIRVEIPIDSFDPNLLFDESEYDNVMKK